VASEGADSLIRRKAGRFIEQHLSSTVLVPWDERMGVSSGSQLLTPQRERYPDIAPSCVSAHADLEFAVAWPISALEVLRNHYAWADLVASIAKGA
jgi:hypothetical protein